MSKARVNIKSEYHGNDPSILLPFYERCKYFTPISIVLKYTLLSLGKCKHTNFCSIIYFSHTKL